MSEHPERDIDDPAPPSRAARTTATGYRSVSYFMSADLHARLKAAWWATRDQPDGAPTLSALVERLFSDHVLELERTKNDGAPFPIAPRTAQGASREGGPDYRYVAYYLPADLHARLKAAWWALREAPSLSAVVEQLLAGEARRLELAHNAGERFAPAPDSARGVNTAAARRQGEWMRREWESRRRAAE